MATSDRRIRQEPLVRVMAEAPTAHEAQAVRDRLAARVRDTIA